ncbi:MAG: hypothetical protein ABIV48_11630 [Pyrinomonadaceae bacterium]
MKKDEMTDELRPEYDLSTLKNQVRGKYVDRFRKSSNIVLLDPEVHEAFPNSESVNTALKGLIDLAKASVSTRN